MKYLPLTLFICGFATCLSAGPITINNPSFEADVLTCSPGAPGCSTNDSITGWTGISVFGTQYGVYKPGPASYPTGIPDGVNVAYLLEDGPTESISQTLSATLQANDTYTLNSFAGIRLDSGVFNPGLGCYGLSVNLEAGGTVLVADDNARCSAAGTFEALTLSYSSGANPAQLGDPLEIVLTAGGSGSYYEPAEIDFDNLSLSDTLSTVSSAPEPASCLLLIRLFQQTASSSVEGVPRPAFPKTLREFQSKFANEEACQQYLAACRWPDGFECPRCGNRRAYELMKLSRWQCTNCRNQVSLTAGTILHNMKTPLTAWFWAAYLMTTDKRGVSALLLQRQLGLRRYETAWMMLHKFRRAMVNVAREPLRGQVEVDDTWVGGTQAGLRGSRQLKGRKAAMVLVAVEKRGRATGRARMAVIPDFKSTTLIAFLKQNVAPGSTVYTDGLKSFTGLHEAGFKHVPRSQPLRGDLRKGAKSVVPLADRAIGNLQQWLIGTYHGVSRDQLQIYLDEFVFRHNRRRLPMAAFQTLLGLGTSRKPSSYQQIRGALDLSEQPVEN